MELTRKQALELHRQMWVDMQKDLGDNPEYVEREKYKTKWCKEHFPDEHIDNDCFLCEYTRQTLGGCNTCPVVWPVEPYGYCCSGDLKYYTMSISRLLTLPEREAEE